MSGRRTMAKDRPEAWKKEYLGDGVYGAFDGYGIWLTAEDGAQATDAIYVEPTILKALVRFQKEAADGK